MIVQPDPGKNFKQELWDYAVLFSHGKQSEDPSEWVQTFQAVSTNPFGPGRELITKQAIAKWEKEKSLPWLIAALAASDVHTHGLEPLLKAANAIPSSSHGYLPVRYYALRLLITSGKLDAAREELDRLLMPQ